MPARGVYEFFMHGHVFVLLFCVELRRNSVEIVLDLLSKKIYSGYKFSIMRGIFQFPVWWWCLLHGIIVVIMYGLLEPLFEL